MADAVPAKGNVLGKLVPARYILAVLGSIGMAIIYGLKVNLSVALVAMLNHTAIKESGDHSHGLNFTAPPPQCAPPAVNGSIAIKPQDGPFDWDEPSQGLLKSCYFWGYFISQFPGAWVAERFSAKWVMFFSVFINVFGTLLTPPTAVLHISLVIFMRVLEGIGGGVTFPAMHVMLASWAPPNERSVMSAIVYAGTALGTVISMLLAGLLAGWFGWEWVFYVMGGLSCIWLVLWLIFIQDSPSKQPLISQEEREFINSSLGKGDGHAVKRSVPWKKVFTSGPFLGILIAHTCSNWGWYMLLIELPFYMKQVLQLEIKQNATATAVPFLTLWFFSIAISKTLDTFRSKGVITTSTARKIATFCASFIPLCCLLALCYIGCNTTAAIILVGVGITSIGGMFSGFLSNHIDIAPNFAGSLMAVTNTVATIPGICVPIFVGWITHGNQTIEAWRVIFFVTIGLYIIEIIAYLLLGSGDEQSWNKVDEDNKTGPEATPLRVQEKQANYNTNEKDEA